MSTELRPFLDNLWRWKNGQSELDFTAVEVLEVGNLEKSEWSETFEQLMRNRLIIGAFRYGRAHTEKPKYDRISSAIKRLKKYTESGNTEYLVDVANLCLLEFEEGTHFKKHFAAIDDGEHVTL